MAKPGVATLAVRAWPHVIACGPGGSSRSSDSSSYFLARRTRWRTAAATTGVRLLRFIPMPATSFARMRCRERQSGKRFEILWKLRCLRSVASFAMKVGLNKPDARPTIVFDGTCVLSNSWVDFLLGTATGPLSLRGDAGGAGVHCSRRMGSIRTIRRRPIDRREGRAPRYQWHPAHHGGSRRCVARDARDARRAAPLRDRLSRLVARNRYRSFGRHAACHIPAPQRRIGSWIRACRQRRRDRGIVERVLTILQREQIQEGRRTAPLSMPRASLRARTTAGVAGCAVGSHVSDDRPTSFKVAQSCPTPPMSTYIDPTSLPHDDQRSLSAGSVGARSRERA